VTRDERRELLADLRAAGVQRWREGDVEIVLGPPVLPAPQPGQGAAGSLGAHGLTPDEQSALFQHETVTVGRG
jgi:hypothetical protein